MRIGQLARLLGIKTSRIRFYEARGLISPTVRGPNGYRIYEERTAKILSFVGEAQRLGFTLRDIAAFLRPPSGEQPTPERLVPQLRAKLAEVDAQVAEARRRRRALARLLRELTGGIS